MSHLIHPIPAPLPMISRTEVHYRAPWLIAAGSIQGPVKPGKASPELNDDAFRIGASGEVAWLIVADGVGSVPHAAAGAHYATYYLDRYLYSADPAVAADPQTLKDGYDYVRFQLAGHAREANAELKDFGTTLLTVILTPDRVVAAKVGDGTILTMEPGAGDAMTYVKRAEIVDGVTADGAIVPITSPQWADYFTTEDISPEAQRVSAVALMSDGGEPYFFQNNHPHTALIDKFAAAILNQPDKGLRGANPILQATLQNAIDHPRTFGEDDRTFIIAMRDHCGRL